MRDHARRGAVERPPSGPQRAQRRTRAQGPVDVVLVSEDVADHDGIREYEQAREIVKSPYPIFACPGNHDKRAALKAARHAAR